MAYIIKTKRGYVGRFVLDDAGYWQRMFGLVATGSPFSYWTRTNEKDQAWRFETPEAAAEVSVLLNSGSVFDEISTSPVWLFPFAANLMDD